MIFSFAPSPGLQGLPGVVPVGGLAGLVAD